MVVDEEEFNKWITEHNKEIYNQAINDFMKECLEYKDLTFKQEHIERLEIIKNSLIK